MSNPEGKERKSSLALMLLIVMVVTAGALFFLREGPPVQKKEAIEEIYLPGYPLYSEGAERVPVKLFFPDKEFSLNEENREIYSSKDPVNRLRQVLVLLLHGPRSDHLLPVFPEGVRLRELYLYEGCAYVDLKASPENPLNVGCLMEHLAVLSIQASLSKNFQEVEKVKILVNGQETESLFGHVDVREPFLND